MARSEELPVRMDRLESQIVQLRAEMHGEFSAVRQEMRDGFSAVDEQFAAVRSEIQTGDEETRRYMRLLFEEYVGRIRIIDEGNNLDG